MSDKGKIERAIERLNERKDACGLDVRRVEGEDVGRKMMLGTDLDWDELQRVKKAVVNPPMVAEALKAGVPLFEILFGMWADGLVTGVLVEEEPD